MFISYATIANGRIGAALEDGLATFGRRWNDPVALDVFRDLSDLPATSDLSRELVAHLDASEWLVVLASPRSAASTWVRWEVSHWLQTRGSDRILVVLVDGELQWDYAQSRFDPNASTAIMPELIDAHRIVPKWVDLRWANTADFSPDDERFFDAIADLSATIRGIAKERLISRHWIEHGRGLSRRLAQHSRLAVDHDCRLALLLADAAYVLDPVPETIETLAHIIEATSMVTATLAADGDVTCLAPTPDGAGLIVGRRDGTVERWDPATGTVVARSQPRAGDAPTALAISASLDSLVAGYGDGGVALHSLTETQVRHLADTPITTAAIAQSNRWVAAGGRDRVYLWDVPEDRHSAVDVSCINVAKLMFHANTLLIYDWGELLELDLSTGAARTIGGLPILPRPGPLAFDIAGRFGALAQLDGGGILIEQIGPSAPTATASVQGPPGFAQAVALAPGGSHVAMASGDRLMIWDILTPDHVQFDQPAAPPGLEQLVLGPDGIWAALQGPTRCELRSTATSTLSRAVRTDSVGVPTAIQAVVSVDINPSGTHVVWITSPSASGLYADSPCVSTWLIDSSLDGPNLDSTELSDAQQVRFLDDDRVEIIGLYQPVTEIWNIRTNERQRIEDPTSSDDAERRFYAALPPTAEAREVSFEQATIVVREGPRTIDVVPQDEPTYPVRLDESGRLLARALRSGRLIVRNVDTGTDLWSAPSPELADLQFCPNGKMLATVTSQGRLVLLDTAHGQIIARLPVTPSPVQRLRFSRNGQLLAVGGVGGLLTLVDTDTTGWSRRARQRAGTMLTPEELRTYGIEDVLLAIRPPGEGVSRTH